MGSEEKRLLQQELARQGFALRIDRWPAKATFYKPDGEAMPNLPSDPFSMQRYLRRGFTLVKPEVPVVKALSLAQGETVGVADAGPASYPCPSCNFVAKSRIGWVSHTQRKHPNEQGGKNNGLSSNN